MKLQIFNRANSGNKVLSGPAITIRINGTISFNPALMKLVGMKLNDGVQIAQSEEDPRDWYIFKSKHEDSFKIRGNEETGWMVIQSSSLAQKIIVSMDHETSISVPVSTDPEKFEKNDLFLLIASKAISRKRKTE